MDKPEDTYGELEQYFALQEEIFEHFGYVEDWRVIPLENNTNCYWYLTGEGSGDEVLYHPDLESLQDVNAGNYYSAEIYTQCFLPKWVYRADDYTMVCADTRTDGNKFLMIFDNRLEIDRPDG